MKIMKNNMKFFAVSCHPERSRLLSGKRAIIFLFFLAISFTALSQEVLLDLEVNPVLFSKHTASEKSIMNNQEYYPIDTMKLPFIDDFSGDKFKRYYNWEYSDSLDLVVCDGGPACSLDSTWHYYYTLDTFSTNNNFIIDSTNAILDSSVAYSLSEFIFCNPFVPGDNDADFFFFPNTVSIFDTLGVLRIDSVLSSQNCFSTVRSTNIFTAIRFTIGGNYVDSIQYSPDTTWHYFLLDTNLTDTIGGVPDSSVALPSFQVELYNGYDPFIPNDTVSYWLPYNTYETLDSLGNHVSGSDSTVNIPYSVLINNHDTIYIREPEYDDETVWIDNYAFRNSTYPINPPSIGVATLDGVDETGMPYNFVTGLPYGVADYLTSKPIDLAAYEPSNNLFLSFYYQAQGRGNAPEQNDSLILQFRTPTNEWRNIWYVEGDELSIDSMFKQVMVPLDSTIWFEKGFQFRFMNYATLSGNVDHWHIDYVYLKSLRTINDTLPNDVSIIYPIGSVLKKYQSMPWSHFKADTLTAMGDSSIIFLKNHTQDVVNVALEKIIYDEEKVELFHPQTEATNASPFTFCSNNNASCNSTIPLQADLNAFFFPTIGNTNDSAEFEVLSLIRPDPGHNIITSNDTVRFNQLFHNYYAYDDGTAENGYGLEIQSPTGVSMAAYRFNMPIEDKLRGVRFYFNPQLEDVSQKLFSLMVWTGGETPETLVYQKDSLSPVYSPGLNYFRTYTINDTDLVLQPGNFFVGWMQLSNYRMNVGFDRNLTANENMFYNILGGGWLQSQLPGAWMIRPVFSSDTLPPDVFSIEENEVMSEFNVFPNPASDEVYIVAMNETGNSNNYFVNIFNSTGSMVKQVSSLPRSVSISELAPGFYFINIQNKETQEQKTYKLVISR